MTDDFVFHGRISDLDPDLYDLLQREKERQEQSIILIPSESAAPPAVEEAMGNKFGNVYAEGYPRESSRRQTEAEILDFERELAHYRRNSDPRYYKGVEYADILEALARRRAAELFAANGLTADDLYVNVQPLSGGPANSALYTAILQPGDTIMGLKLSHGGHLSHGAPVNRSGQVYHSVSYVVDADTEQLDYEAIEKLAVETQPQVIVAGFSAYPLVVDWQRFRDIADKVGAHFHADIAHISGLVAAGVHPSPVGIADSVMTTTHKSLCGPRGAILMTHHKALAGKLDRAVFPGEQGGGHFNTIGALALALKLAQTPQFEALQRQIVANAARLAAQLQERGLRIVAGKSENHLLLIDCNSVKGETGVTLEGDTAARVLDVAGIVTNKNTIPGDKSALSPTGVRIGTVWISQLGYKTAEIDKLAEAIATLLTNTTPFEYAGSVRRRTRRGKVTPAALRQARSLVRDLTHQPDPTAELDDNSHTLHIRGKAASRFLHHALSSDVFALGDGDAQPTRLLSDENDWLATLQRATAASYHLRFGSPEEAAQAQTWLRDLSDGYVWLPGGDVYAKLAGPVVVTVDREAEVAPPDTAAREAAVAKKTFFVGQNRIAPVEQAPLPAFSWSAPEDEPLKRTVFYDAHVAAGAKMVPFSGYDMPVWYSSVSEEHAAVRQGAALFDVSHMGIFMATGPHAQAFINSVTSNDVNRLRVGKSHYTYLFAPDGRVIDDLMVYRLCEEEFMLVVNAGNNDEDWAWLTAVNEKRVQIDPARPHLTIGHTCELRDSRAAGERVLIALQGPQAAAVLAKLADEPALEKTLTRMAWAAIKPMQIGGYDLLVSRSGYTGERVAYELFVSPDTAVAFWEALVAAGATPAGLAARDSTRTEAGLPLHGHELAGPLNIDPDTACFGMYVKLSKPFFVGKAAYTATHETHQHTIVRFQMDEKGVRLPQQGDPILDKRGKVMGWVTSCAMGQDGYLVGLAYVPLAERFRGRKLAIYQMGGGERGLKLPRTLKLGARLPTPDVATVLSRFPRR